VLASRATSVTRAVASWVMEVAVKQAVASTCRRHEPGRHEAQARVWWSCLPGRALREGMWSPGRQRNGTPYILTSRN
jgi:hypothetical protein